MSAIKSFAPAPAAVALAALLAPWLRSLLRGPDATQEAKPAAATVGPAWAAPGGVPNPIWDFPVSGASHRLTLIQSSALARGRSQRTSSTRAAAEASESFGQNGSLQRNRSRKDMPPLAQRSSPKASAKNGTKSAASAKNGTRSKAPAKNGTRSKAAAKNGSDSKLPAQDASSNNKHGWLWHEKRAVPSANGTTKVRHVDLRGNWDAVAAAMKRLLHVVGDRKQAGGRAGDATHKSAVGQRLNSIGKAEDVAQTSVTHHATATQAAQRSFSPCPMEADRLELPFVANESVSDGSIASFSNTQVMGNHSSTGKSSKHGWQWRMKHASNGSNGTTDLPGNSKAGSNHSKHGWLWHQKRAANGTTKEAASNHSKHGWLWHQKNAAHVDGGTTTEAASNHSKHARQWHQKNASEGVDLASLSKMGVVRNNLGGVGPNKDDPQELTIGPSFFWSGDVIDMVLTNTTEYTPWQSNKNGVVGWFGILNVKAGTSVGLEARFRRRDTGEEVPSPGVVYLVVTDMDMQNDGRGVETVEVYNVSVLEMQANSSIEVNRSGNAMKFTATDYGNYAQVPQNVEELTNRYMYKTFVAGFYQQSVIKLTFEVGPGFAGRNFIFSVQEQHHIGPDVVRMDANSLSDGPVLIPQQSVPAGQIAPASLSPFAHDAPMAVQDAPMAAQALASQAQAAAEAVRALTGLTAREAAQASNSSSPQVKAANQVYEAAANAVAASEAARKLASTAPAVSPAADVPQLANAEAVQFQPAGEGVLAAHNAHVHAAVAEAVAQTAIAEGVVAQLVGQSLPEAPASGTDDGRVGEVNTTAVLFGKRAQAALQSADEAQSAAEKADAIQSELSSATPGTPQQYLSSTGLKAAAATAAVASSHAQGAAEDVLIETLNLTTPGIIPRIKHLAGLAEEKALAAATAAKLAAASAAQGAADAEMGGSEGDMLEKRKQLAQNSSRHAEASQFAHDESKESLRMLDGIPDDTPDTDYVSIASASAYWAEVEAAKAEAACEAAAAIVDASAANVREDGVIKRIPDGACSTVPAQEAEVAAHQAQLAISAEDAGKTNQREQALAALTHTKLAAISASKAHVKAADASLRHVEALKEQEGAEAASAEAAPAASPDGATALMRAEMTEQAMGQAEQVADALAARMPTAVSNSNPEEQQQMVNITTAAMAAVFLSPEAITGVITALGLISGAAPLPQLGPMIQNVIVAMSCRGKAGPRGQGLALVQLGGEERTQATSSDDGGIFYLPGFPGMPFVVLIAGFAYILQVITRSVNQVLEANAKHHSRASMPRLCNLATLMLYVALAVMFIGLVAAPTGSLTHNEICATWIALAYLVIFLIWHTLGFQDRKSYGVAVAELTLQNCIFGPMLASIILAVEYTAIKRDISVPNDVQAWIFALTGCYLVQVTLAACTPCLYKATLQPVDSWVSEDRVALVVHAVDNDFMTLAIRWQRVVAMFVTYVGVATVCSFLWLVNARNMRPLVICSAVYFCTFLVAWVVGRCEHRPFVTNFLKTAKDLAFLGPIIAAFLLTIVTI